MNIAVNINESTVARPAGAGVFGALPDHAPAARYGFLLTDIEGSSLRWLHHRAAMQTAVAQHDEIMRAAIAAHHGTVFKTGGDAFFAAFREPADVARAAIAAQQALAGRDWSAVGGLKVRIALHYGVAEERAGDYFGPAVNRAARLLNLAHGGQTLASDSLAELLDGERELPALLRRLGEHPLDDPGQAVAIFQVDVPGLPRELRPLRALDTRPTNLPRNLTQLIGREGELDAVEKLLAESRLLTVTGAGGMGKTRLALEVGLRNVGQFSDGAWLVDLAPLSDPDLVPSAVATALGIPLSGSKPPISVLVSRLKDRKLLLILDNCEHVIASSASLAEALLSASVGVRILATSQEPLGATGEQTFLLSLLPVCENIAPSAAELMTSGSAQLFVERAKAIDPRFEIDDRNAPAVAAICRRLDGIPLAIEMAAARAPALGVDWLVKKLDERFRVLTAGRRTALPRQQTLRATLDWSFGLLGKQDRAVLRRLAIFSGRFTLEAASVIASDESIDEFEVIDRLSHLVARSLVVAYTNDSGTRYRLLETTRAYALEKLAKARETAALAHRHAQYFRNLFERAPGDWLRLPDAAWRPVYAPERDNLRAALDWALGPGGDAAIGVALAAASGPVWWELSLLSEGRQRLHAATERVTASTPEIDQARLWLFSGMLWGDGAPAKAIAAFDKAITLYRRLGDAAGLGYSLARLGARAALMGRVEQASSAIREALPVLQNAGVPKALALYYEAFGILNMLNGALAEARTNYEKALALYRGAGVERSVLNLLTSLADTTWALGDLDAALAVCKESIGLMRQSTMAPKLSMGACLSNLAGVHTERGELEDALAAAREGLPLLNEAGYAWGAMDLLGLRAALAGRLDNAARMAGFADATFASKGTSRQPNEARLRDRLHAVLKEKLAPDELAQLLSAGAAMTEDEACHIALLD